MKAIIQRNLPLNQKYIITDKKYIPLIESFGTCCDNCGKLIANIATVKHENGKSFNIGFDCLETILINNSLLSTGDIELYHRVKTMIPKIIRFSKEIKEITGANNGIDAIVFEQKMFEDDIFFTYYIVKNGYKPSNSYFKARGIDFDFLIETLKNIFPKIHIGVMGKNQKITEYVQTIKSNNSLT